MVQSSKLTKSFGFILSSFIVALVIAVNVYPVWTWQRQLSLEEAPTVRGEVVSKGSSTSTKGTPSYWVTYTYEAPETDGTLKSFQVELDVESHIYQQVSEGTKIIVHYLPSDPSVSNIHNNSMSLSYWFVICVLVDGFFLFITFIILRDVIRKRRENQS